MEFRTEHLVLRDVELDDVDGLLAVSLSNPDFLLTHEGSADEPGRFDRGMLERDLGVIDMDPGQHALTIATQDGEEVVGWAVLLDEHPRDHVPWIGLLQIHATHQRQGLGTEAAHALIGWAASLGQRAVRLGVDEGNDRAMAFWTSVGFEQVDRRERDSPLGKMGVRILERSTGTS